MKRAVYPQYPVFIVDDDESFSRTAAITLLSEGISNITICNDNSQLFELIEKYHPGIILLDVMMPHHTGTELLPQLKKDHPDIAVLMISGVNEVKTAVDAMKNGAFDYIVKPSRKEELLSSIKKAIEFHDIRKETAALKQTVLDNKLKNPEAFSQIVTRNETLINLFKYTEAIATAFLPALIYGETGVGKELLARALHTLSNRNGNFLCVNIAGLDDSMFSDTLFGHRRGAFSGADSERRGLIEEAAGGTLFLDEIGDLSPESQVKLLRLIQDGSYYPLGSDLPKHSTARIIAATNRNLHEMQNNGSFRKDLYFRLEAHLLHIPPLRERLNDLPLLVEHLFQEASDELQKKKPSYPPELITLLRQYSFPGNIRELRGMIFNATSRHTTGILSLNTFKIKCGRSKLDSPTRHETTDTFSFPQQLPTLDELQQALINEAFKRASGNKSLAAHMIGLTRQTLNNWMKKNKTTSSNSQSLTQSLKP
ncbi:MAG: sigma-54-dependent Fis family transcriptional regulator [Chitinispirillaceae bacterium]|nr:sigma-54-dependent Fis family transcriptional regulator [Chitinispirillaceae bacterium]